MALRGPFVSLFVLLSVALLAGSDVAAQRGQRSGPPDIRPAMTSIAGLWDLESTRGDRADRAADMATRDLPPERRDRAYRDLIARLDAPESLAIEQNGRYVTVASSNGPRVTFQADGRTIRLQYMTPDDGAALLEFARSVPRHDLLFLRTDITTVEGVNEWVDGVLQGQMGVILAYDDTRLLGFSSVTRNPTSWARHIAEPN